MRNAPKDPEFSSSAMVRSHTENYNRPNNINNRPISFIITHLIFSFIKISRSGLPVNLSILLMVGL